MSFENTQTQGGLTTAQRTDRIKREIAKAGDDLRLRHPLLRRTDLLGVLILSASLAGMIGSGVAYLGGLIPWWVCVPVTAFFAAFTHELEHDLIHMMYFRKRALPRNLMMALVWLARPSTINPWIRRKLHLHHHLHSGTETDIEERAITNGETWGLKRLVMTGDNALAIVLRLNRAPNAKLRLRMLTRGLIGYFPLGWLNWGAWHVFLGFHLIDAVTRLAGHDLAWSAGTLTVMHVVDVAVVVLVAPNVLRTFALHFVSSNMHYYGDVEDGNVTQQCQVLNPWWLLPLQAFCCNFGSTHAIHHFVVKEPFYIRQLTSKRAHAVMRQMGVRFNDFGTFRRANRFLPQPVPQASGLAQAA